MQVLVLLLLLFAGGEVSSFASAGPCIGNSIVKKVSFENPLGLSSAQKGKLNRVLMNRCFDGPDGASLSEAIYQQLWEFGYKKLFVHDPIIRVLGKNLRPAPVSVTIDFALGTSEGRKAR